MDSQALAASWRKCRWRQLHVVGGGAREGAGLAPPRMPLRLPGAVASDASLTWWEGRCEGVSLALPRQAGGAMATILEKLNTELPQRRSDGHDLREMALGMAFEAARWPRSSRNCTQNGFRGSAMATIFGRCHTELPPSLQDALGEGHEPRGWGGCRKIKKSSPSTAG